jgi:EmrB/QacA subfamily drug resistance transporter
VVAQAPDPRRWKALALVATAVFMTVLDIAIVNVALPSLGKDLHFTPGNLQWVVTAYSLTFGGFLLLGGRAADLLGRRRLFMVGVALFTSASLLAGLSVSEGMLIGARALQGLGAAIVSPAALSIITTTFAEGPERNKALGIWGAVGGSGAAAGVLMGGVLTEYLGWAWIFFVNVPVGAAVLLLTRRLVRESKAEGAAEGYDALGAVTITAALLILVYAVSRAPEEGWATARTLGLLAVSVLLHALFVAVELRARAPLVPLRIFRIKLFRAANVVGLMVGGTVVGSFFLLTLYMQRVLHFSSLRAGLCFLATAGTSVVAAGAAQALVTRVGTKPVMLVGLGCLSAGQLWYTQISPHGSYLVDLLPGFLITGVGIAFGFVPVSIAAFAGVGPRDAGLASGMINTSQQIGGAIGTAVVSSVGTGHASALLAGGSSSAVALTSGYSWGFWVGASIGLTGFAATLFLIPRRIAR